MTAPVKRALVASIGGTVTVLPVLVLRALLAAALLGLGPQSAGLLTFLPLELLLPFLTALVAIKARPGIKSLSLAVVVTLVAMVGAPLLLALALGQELVRHFGEGGDGWAMLLGLVPGLGALGVFGMLMVGLPVVVTGFCATAGLDALHVRRRRLAARGNESILGLSAEDDAALARELRALAGEASSLGLAQLAGALFEAHAALAAVASMLGRKLSPTEITFQRYLGSALHLYRMIVRQARGGVALASAGVTPEAARELDRVAGQCDEGIRALRETAQAMARLSLGGAGGAVELEIAVKDLQELARRVDKY